MINVVKIGGNVIDNPEALQSFLKDFARLEGKKILVHGGGKEATRLSASMGIETVMIEGRRVTDRETLDIVTMVYAGLINKRVVARLQALGCNAVGLTGADALVIPAKRRPPVRKGEQVIDYGHVGDIDPTRVNTEFLKLLLTNGYTPVFCAICCSPEDGLLNCNADSVASAVARAAATIEPARLTYCFEKPGVMTDVDDDSSVMPMVDTQKFEQLKAEGIVASGMIPKIQNALQSASEGVEEVRICRAEALLSEGGTRIRL